ncbi:MAG: SAM-dependent methyltransferase [Rhodospirillaceae bacterium]|nr:SAM-dependent methyltransferase [Rhodospirillaceae bacterium]
MFEKIIHKILFFKKDSSMNSKWKNYYSITGNRKPRETLKFAIKQFETETFLAEPYDAIDLGCGSGRDTIELLLNQWRVTAIDSEITAIEGLMQRTDIPAKASIRTICSRFEETLFPSPVHLVNSSFALPLVPPNKFPALWENILSSLITGGRIACQLYGERDSWFGNPRMTFFSHSEIMALLKSLNVELFREEEEDSKTPRGYYKHWHIFHIVAQKF